MFGSVIIFTGGNLMKRCIVLLFVCFFGHLVLLGLLNGAVRERPAVTMTDPTSVPLAFTQNDGQWSDSILYRASARGATMWFTNGGLTTSLRGR